MSTFFRLESFSNKVKVLDDYVQSLIQLPITLCIDEFLLTLFCFIEKNKAIPSSFTGKMMFLSIKGKNITNGTFTDRKITDKKYHMPLMY